jgi:hypothetical protein
MPTIPPAIRHRCPIVTYLSSFSILHLLLQYIFPLKALLHLGSIGGVTLSELSQGAIDLVPGKSLPLWNLSLFQSGGVGRVNAPKTRRG